MAVMRCVSVLVLSLLLLMQSAQAAVPPPRTVLRIPGHVLTGSRVVALTFDDGPSPYTPQILDILHTFRARATFFEVGRQVVRYPALARSVVTAGDELGNHTYDHADLLYLPDEVIRLELTQTQQAIRAATGQTPVWFRPPGGAIDSRVSGDAAAIGLHSLLWSVDPRDWSRPGTDAIIQRALSTVRPGAIILMHDGGGDRSETVAALPVILRALQAEGYQFLTVSDLFHLPSPVPCDETAGSHWFAAAGISPLPTHAIYHTWLQLYCRGSNFGPATSPEYVLAPLVVAQDFARTGHRLEWDRKSGTSHVTLIWSWPARVFAAQGIQPLWHTPITAAWFDQFFNGHDWGPALHDPHIQDGATIQCFLRACAVAKGGRVVWEKAATQ